MLDRGILCLIAMLYAIFLGKMVEWARNENRNIYILLLSYIIIMDNYKPLENKIRELQPMYKGLKDRVFYVVKKGFENPYVRTFTVLGATTLATLLLSSNESYAAQNIAQKSQEMYGFFSGLRDGLLWEPNLVMDIFSNFTFAAAGTGVISTPNTGLGYYLGFVLTGGIEGLLGGFLFGNN